jgi:2-polyprenyl-6-methoxyphenol hydroxylase-like FAD-dependent oxidoreductase
MQHRPILVVGAGPTGLTAAMELARLGVPVRIIDKAAGASLTSRALAIQARTLELLSQRGLADELISIGNRVRLVAIHSERRQMGTVDLSTIPSRFNYVLLVAQNQTERLLSEQLERQGVSVERSTELIALCLPEQEDRSPPQPGVTAILRHADGRLEPLEAAYLICAEGSHSRVRHTLNLEFKGRSLGQKYALADLHIEGQIAQDAISIFVVERAFLGLFPMGQRRFRMIASDREQTPANAPGPSLPELQSLFDAHCHIPGRLHDAIWTSRFHINSRMLETFRVQRVFFGGDAAHVHSPAGGQGMNTGIQDMINLGWKLALVYHGLAGDDLLDTYTEERVPVIRRLLDTTERATEALTSQHALAHLLMTHLAPLVLGSDTVREMGARMLSQTEIGYRTSRLSRDQRIAGELRAGDRMPDIQVRESGAAAAVPLYALLDPSRFTLLTTGDVGEALSPSSWVKTVTVAPDPRFLRPDSLVVVRPDAYIGFIGGGDAQADVSAWMEQHFLGGADRAGSAD